MAKPESLPYIPRPMTVHQSPLGLLQGVSLWGVTREPLEHLPSLSQALGIAASEGTTHRHSHSLLPMQLRYEPLSVILSDYAQLHCSLCPESLVVCRFWTCMLLSPSWRVSYLSLYRTGIYTLPMIMIFNLQITGFSFRFHLNCRSSFLLCLLFGNSCVSYCAA